MTQRFFFITFTSKGIDFTKKLSVYEGMTVQNAFIANYGRRVNDHEYRLLAKGEYRLQEVPFDQWKAEERYVW